jgi:pimeloyl-ACP methyl ester carboxylesterase
MPTQRPFPGEYRASNGLFYKVTGNGDPLLLLHGLMATGAMFDPLVPRAGLERHDGLHLHDFRLSSLRSGTVLDRSREHLPVTSRVTSGCAWQDRQKVTLLILRGNRREIFYEVSPTT